MGKRSALLVGCNYPNNPYQLYGCYKDVETMQTLLISRFGFGKKEINIMTDAQNLPVEPTGTNIRRALAQLVRGATEGDTLFFFFSGLGTLVQSPCEDNCPAIVACDFDMINDVEFRHLVDRLPKDATFTFLSDSAHSGGLIFNEKEQMIPNPGGPEPQEQKYHRRKTYPNSSSISKSSDISAHLSEVFGTQVTANFNSANSQSGFIPCPDDDDDNGILLSGCKRNVYSFEVYPNQNKYAAYGAFTDAVKNVSKEHQGKITNREMVKLARVYLQDEGIGQKPCLFCSDDNADAPFLGYVIGKSA